MARSLSQFIQEQEMPAVHNNSGQGSLEQTFVESMLAFSVAQCYTEQAELLSFADENHLYIQEADDKKESIFKRAGTAVKNAWKWFIEMLKSLWDKIIGFFKKTKPKDVAKEYKDIMDRFKELYPELDDTTEAQVFFKKLAEKFPKAKIDTNIGDAYAIVKYETVLKTVLALNEQLDKYIDAVKNGQGVDGSADFVAGLRKSYWDDTKNAKNMGGKNDIDVNSETKKGEKMSIGEVINKLESFGDGSELTTACSVCKNKLNTLEKELEAMAKKNGPTPVSDRSNEVYNNGGGVKYTDGNYKAVGDRTGKPGEMQDLFTSSADISALKKFVTTMTKQEADVTGAMIKWADNAKRILGTMRGELKEDKEYELESFYFV